MKTYLDELKYFIKKWYFTAFLLLIALIGFGFTTSHIAINIDSLASDRYHANDYIMLSSGRFGMSFWMLPFCNGLYQVEDSFAMGVFGVLMLMLAAINFCILFRRASNDTISFPAYMVFAAAFVSYPLINEIWEYNGMELIIGGGYLFISLSVLLLYDQIQSKKINILKSSAILLMLTVVCASYESLIAVYVFVVLTVLYMRERQAKNWKQHLHEGGIYACAIICGLILRLVIHRILVAVMGLTITTNGETEIMWLNGESNIKILKQLIENVLLKHFLLSPLYLPLLIFVLCAIGFTVYAIYNLCKKRIFASLLMIGILASNELMSIVQGSAAPYRVCQTFALMVALSFMLAANRLRWKQIIPLLLCVVCLCQATALNRLFTLNQLRYEEEAAVIREIGKDLESEHDTSKPVILIGSYIFNDRINRQIYLYPETKKYNYAQKIKQITNYDFSIESLKFPETNVNSVILWSAITHDLGGDMLHNVFEYHGYDDIFGTQDYENDLNRYIKLNEESSIPHYPADGYITELDDLIIVKVS